MQLVFYNVAKYQSLNEALHFEDGIVILAFQYHITDGPQNPAYHFLSEVIPLVQQAGHSTNVKHGINGLKTLVADINLEEYLSYHGSLTHPPCQNTVTWIVFTEKISISSELVWSSAEKFLFSWLHSSWRDKNVTKFNEMNVNTFQTEIVQKAKQTKYRVVE